LIWAGGLVTTYDAGMAVPDWPSTFGYNLWLYPWSTWFSGPWDLFIEHGHRLLGTLVGILSIAFVVTVYRFERRLWMRRMAWICLAGVLLQGALGGARVLLDDRQLAMIHGCVGPSFFAFCAALAVMTSRFWREAPVATMPGAGSGLDRLSVLTAGLALVQLLLGAQVRHISIMSGPGVFRAFVFFHLVVAAALLVHALLLVARTFRAKPRSTNLTRPAVSLALLIGLQFVLGPATWVVNYGWPTWLAEMPFAAGHIVQAKSFLQAMIVTAHVAVGSLVLAYSVVVAMRSFRFMRMDATALGSTAMLVGLAT
jgi:cytochrome c oxidase assembly protein subunit 15